MSVYKRGSAWWIQYFANGKRLRESVEKVTGKNTERAAKALEKKRLGELEAGTLVGLDEKRVRLSDLRALLEADYADKERRSGERAARAWKHLERHFPHNPRAVGIATGRLHRYVADRKGEGAKPATIRNELSVLRRAYNVAVEREELRRNTVPTFPSLHVDNARDEFYSDAELAAVRKQLPAPLRNLWTVGAWTGWRRTSYSTCGGRKWTSRAV